MCCNSVIQFLQFFIDVTDLLHEVLTLFVQLPKYAILDVFNLKSGLEGARNMVKLLFVVEVRHYRLRLQSLTQLKEVILLLCMGDGSALLD